MQPETGTAWKSGEAKAYEVVKHGPDGAQFLDSALYASLVPEKVKDARAIDHGAGTGPWTEYLLKQGARVVVSYDLNSAMIEQGKETRFESINDIPYETHRVAGVAGRARIMVADVTHIPLQTHKDKNGYFNLGLSINVGCNLPGEIETKNGTVDIFKGHFKEAFRVTEPGGEMLVTAPNSLTTVFTNGADVSNLQTEIQNKWKETADHSKDSAKALIRAYPHLLRATFVLDADNMPVLITKENAHLVKNGAPIIRKIPGVVVDNMYHTAEEYREAALAAGWQIVEDVEESFASEESRATYNQSHKESEQLGPEYVGNPPFLILKLKKSTAS